MHDMSRRVSEALGQDVGCLRELTRHDLVGYVRRTVCRFLVANGYVTRWIAEDCADAAFGAGGTK